MMLRAFYPPSLLRPRARGAFAQRVDLYVPFNEKDEAKSAGARWDAEKRVWFCDDDNTQLVARFARQNGQQQPQKTSPPPASSPAYVAQSNDTAPAKEENKHYLLVSFTQKDQAKALGAKWDPAAKLWWVADANSEAAQLFPSAARAPASGNAKRTLKSLRESNQAFVDDEETRKNAPF